MEPYQRASRAMRESEEQPFNVLKNTGLAAIGGGTAGIASKAIGKIVPAVGALISKYVPDNLMQAGLSKINPKLGTFMKSVLDAGYTHDDVREFLGEKIEKSQQPQTKQQESQEQQKEKPKDGRNIIEQYSPELHQFIANEVASGRKPIEAGALAQNDKRFSDVIKKLSEEHNTPWSSIIDSIYGTGEQAGALKEQQQQSGNSGQVGQGQQALMEILSRINQKLGQ